MITTIKRFSLRTGLLFLAVSSLLSCGGGSGNSTQPGEVLPVGSRLQLTMNNLSQLGGGPRSNASFLLDLVIEGTGIASVTWKDQTSLSGKTAFLYYVEGNVGHFQTSFHYRDGTHIAPGPVITTTGAVVQITAQLALPEDSQTMLNQTYAGTCTCRVVIDSSITSGEYSGTFEGTGAYNVAHPL